MGLFGMFSQKETTKSIQEYLKKGAIVLDVRTLLEWNEGHIEGALQIWRNHIENKSYPYGGMLAQPEDIESLISSLGITNEDAIIVYDDRGSCDAARFWWIMQYYNFKRVKILNGGIDAWKEIKGNITTEKSKIQPSQFKFGTTFNNSINISKEELLKRLNTNSKAIILDTRNIEEFSGKRQKEGAAKGGRIPGSKLFDWDKAIDYSNNKKLKSVQEIKEHVRFLNIKETDTIITYCHSGVRSAHTYFVLKELLGFQNVYNYDGSWTEWSFFEELPYKKDSITVINK
jgi:thiosulfate/3-mercaptopyruvate sulfurtransferase